MVVHRRATILVLLFLFINITWMAYSYWSAVTVDYDDIEIPLGEQAVIKVSPTINPNYRLVPYGSFKGEGEIDEYIFNYFVTFNKTGYLKVIIPEDSIVIGNGEHRFNSLATIQISYGSTLDYNNRELELITNFENWNEEKKQFEMEILIRVFVVAPTNINDYEEAYLALKSQSIKFDVIFEALENN